MKPTNEERRNIARKLRDVADRLGGNMDGHEFAHYVADAVIEKEKTTWNELTLTVAALIDPDYTSEESGYFILPKPKDPLVCRYSSVDGSVYDIINENVREWQKQIDEDIQQRLFETFRRTCHDADHMGDAIKYSKCGEATRETLYWVDVGEDARTVKGRRPLFCARCGAKVTDNANF